MKLTNYVLIFYRQCSKQTGAWSTRLGEDLREIVKSDNFHRPGGPRALLEDHRVRHDGTRAGFRHAYGMFSFLF